MLKLNRQLARIRQRDGFSIIEVLTSMAVATIGVFGIMVMIPFAVRQSQRGLDNDAANAVGRDAIEEMQIQGYFEADASGSLSRINVPAAAPSVIHFDPIGVAGGLGNDNVGIGFEIVRVTGLNPVGNQLSVREASRLCRSSDDMSYVDADDTDGIALPQPIFDVDGAGVSIKRQSAGRISWSMILVPEKAASTSGVDASGQPIPIHRLRTYTLVYRDRELLTDTTFDFANPNVPMFVSQVTGVETAPGGISPSSIISKDDWVMVINQVPEPMPGQDFQGAIAPYDAQVMFARVTRTTETGVFIEGGSFYFHGPVGPPEATKLVHLKNVINVFERSVAIED